VVVGCRFVGTRGRGVHFPSVSAGAAVLISDCDLQGTTHDAVRVIGAQWHAHVLRNTIHGVVSHNHRPMDISTSVPSSVAPRTVSHVVRGNTVTLDPSRSRYGLYLYMRYVRSAQSLVLEDNLVNATGMTANAADWLVHVNVGAAPLDPPEPTTFLIGNRVVGLSQATSTGAIDVSL